MGSLYSGTSVSGYNSNPPPDDGSTGSNNQITWGSTIKAKLADPLNTAIAAMSTAVVSAFSKTISGGTVVKTAVSYAMGPTDQGRCIVATASGITITTPDATSVLNPFAFFFSNQSTGTITLAGNSNGSQTVDGNTSTTIYPGCGGILQTDGSNWFSNGLVQGNIRTANPAFGFDAPINLQPNASVGSNLLTIAVKANNGSDPSTSNPVLIPFRDSTIANGDPVWVAVTSALSISTNATGATLGTASSNVPFRIWVLAFNNAGTVVLALWQSVSGAGTSNPYVNGINEAAVQSTTAISAAATSANVFYTPNGTTLSSKAFRIIGYVDYASGLTTAGTYASAPTTVQLFGPGIKKPGDEMQTVYLSTSTQETGYVSTSYAASTHAQIPITPTSTPNLILVDCRGTGENITTGDSFTTRLSRGTSNNTNMFGNECANTSATGGYLLSFSNFGLDAPGTTSQTTYALQIKVSAGSGNLMAGSTATAMIAKEIMV